MTIRQFGRVRGTPRTIGIPRQMVRGVPRTLQNWGNKRGQESSFGFDAEARAAAGLKDGLIFTALGSPLLKLMENLLKVAPSTFTLSQAGIFICFGFAKDNQIIDDRMECFLTHPFPFTLHISA